MSRLLCEGIAGGLDAVGAEGWMWWSSPGALRNMTRDWIRDHAEEARSRIPEWARLKELMNE